MKPAVLVGIDVGSSSTKAAVLNLAGRELAIARVPTRWTRRAGRVEIEPELLGEAAVTAGRLALHRVGVDVTVVAIGVASLAETGVLLDTRGDPVAPAIAWFDDRGDAQSRSLASTMNGSFTETTGISPDRNPSVVKYRWLLENVPAAEDGVRWLSVAEWIVRLLGGNDLAERSLAARTGWLDVVSGGWSEEMVEWSGCPRSLLPDLAPSCTPAGVASRRFRELAGARLCVAGHDHTCATIGAGATKPGDVLNSCGTAEMFVSIDNTLLTSAQYSRLVPRGVVPGWHALPGRRSLLGAFASGLFVDAVEKSMDTRRLAPAEDLTGAARSRAEVRIDWEQLATPVFRAVSTDRGADPARWRRAAYEAIAIRGRAVLSALASVNGSTNRLIVTGGGARDPTALAIKRAFFGEFELTSVQEAAARGAALLAGCAAGVYPTIDAVPAPVLARSW